MPFPFLCGLDADFTEVGKLTCACPNCGKKNGLNVMKRVQFAHVFALPVHRRSREYFAFCGHCAGSFVLSTPYGIQLEKQGSCPAGTDALIPFQGDDPLF